MANNWQVIQTAPFIGGLNTEVNDLQDATQFTSDELNMVIKNNGTRARRLGIDYEEGYKLSLNTVTNYIEVEVVEDGDTVVKRVELTPAFSCFEWDDVEKERGKSFLVVQAGPKLFFYDMEDENGKPLGVPFSQKQNTFEVDLAKFKLSEDPLNVEYAETPVSFTNIYGALFVCSKAIRPFYLTKLEMEEGEDPEDIPASAILDVSLWHDEGGGNAVSGYREFYLNGVSLGTCTVANGSRPTANYFANFWNDTLGKPRGITAVPHTPYGDLITGGGYAQQYIEFICPLGYIYNGITISMYGYYRKKYKDWKGHTKYNARSYTKTTTTSGFIRANISRNLDVQIRDFEGVEDIYKGIIDLRYGEGLPVRPILPVHDEDATEEELETKKTHSYNLWNQGWNEVITDGKSTPLKEYLDHYKFTDPDDNIEKYYYPSNNYQWFLSKDPSTQAFKPEGLIKIAFGNTRAPTGKATLSYLKQDRSAVSGIEGIPVEYPRTPYFSDIIAYAGRVWYLSGDTILYSQVLLDDLTKCDKCYQEADPTSEKISDLVDTDGGMIQIPEMGEGIRFCLVGEALAVVGTKSIQLISGGQNNAFTATAYVRGAMQAFTTVAPRSFVTTEYGTFFWSDVGIVLLSYQEGFAAQNITENTINTFYQRIPEDAMKKCTGIYNRAQKQIVWCYPSDNNKGLNKMLVYDILKNSWTPFEISTENKRIDGALMPWVVGGISLTNSYKVDNIYPVYAKVPNGYLEVVDDNGVKILGDDPIDKEDQTFKSAVLLCYDNSTGKITFGNFDNLNCLDWAAGDIYGAGANYDSYLVSHPINLNSTAYNKTSPYLLTYFRRTEQGYTLDGKKIYPSACQGAIQWDWNNSGKAGKWDAQQELYRYDKHFDSYEVVDDDGARVVLSTYGVVDGQEVLVDDLDSSIIIVDPIEKGTLLVNDYVFSKTRVYGGGRAFKVKLSSVDNNYFIVENVGFDIYGDARI